MPGPKYPLTEADAERHALAVDKALAAHRAIKPEDRLTTCDICSDLMERGVPHECPEVDVRPDSADLGLTIRLDLWRNR